MKTPPAWDFPIGNWFGKYLGNDWEIFGNYLGTMITGTFSNAGVFRGCLPFGLLGALMERWLAGWLGAAWENQANMRSLKQPMKI